MVYKTWLTSAFDFAVGEFPGDAELRELWQAAWGASPAGFQQILNACLFHITARHEGRLAVFVKVAGDGPLHVFLLDPTVHPQFRRQGLGKELVTSAASLAAERGAEWLHVDFQRALRRSTRRAGLRAAKRA
jgi:ribosomal protein S18 acetylase RimI-like enzyme